MILHQIFGFQKIVDNLTFGSNGYYLDFADSSSLGNDVSETIMIGQ